jgi:hypothetical protein
MEPLEDGSKDDGSEVKRRDEGEGGLNAVVVPDTRPWVRDLSRRSTSTAGRTRWRERNRTRAAALSP